jgi:hypothetical protein
MNDDHPFIGQPIQPPKHPARNQFGMTFNETIILGLIVAAAIIILKNF